MRATTVALAVAVLALAARARAEDTVRLADGGFVRGVVVENRPGDHVTVRLASGVLQRFPASEVRAVEEGAPAAAASTRHVLHVAGAPGLRLEEQVGHFYGIRDGGATFRTLCVAPCDATVEDGFHILAVGGVLGGPPVVTSQRTIARDAELRIDYTSHAAERSGWIAAFAVGEALGLLSAAVGALMVLVDAHASGGGQTGAWGPALSITGLVAVIGSFFFLFGVRPDTASIKFG